MEKRRIREETRRLPLVELTNSLTDSNTTPTPTSTSLYPPTNTSTREEKKN